VDFHPPTLMRRNGSAATKIANTSAIGKDQQRQIIPEKSKAKRGCDDCAKRKRRQKRERGTDRQKDAERDQEG